MDFDLYLRFALALILVLGLIALLAWLLRRFGMGMKMSKGRRLGISEVQMLGPRHKLMLVRRDEVEHLVIIGPAGETVVETGIKAPASFASTLAKEAPKP
jgi:flagellar protein FliO/FliZ